VQFGALEWGKKTQAALSMLPKAKESILCLWRAAPYLLHAAFTNYSSKLNPNFCGQA
jgi:hypothetical protein